MNAHLEYVTSLLRFEEPDCCKPPRSKIKTVSLAGIYKDDAEGEQDPCDCVVCKKAFERRADLAQSDPGWFEALRAAEARLGAQNIRSSHRGGIRRTASHYAIHMAEAGDDWPWAGQRYGRALGPVTEAAFDWPIYRAAMAVVGK